MSLKWTINLIDSNTLIFNTLFKQNFENNHIFTAIFDEIKF